MVKDELDTEIQYSELLEHTADSIEAYSDSIFACATYQLIEKPKDDESPAERIGSLMLYEICKEETKGNITDCVQKLQHLKTNAILDMKWHKNDADNSILTVADSKGEVHFYNFTEKRLVHQNRLIIDAESLCLSTDWCKTVNPHQAAYSMSSGDLCIVQLAESEPTLIHSWKGHSLEAWIIACDYENGNLFYSGADDCRLKLWDLRMGLSNACFTSKYHEMGVCSIQANPIHNHIFASGSYDETIVLWDNRSMKAPLGELKTGGGVWRLKWHPQFSRMLLAACMHNGYKIIEYNIDFSTGKLVCNYKNHKSLAYGVDWCLTTDPPTNTNNPNDLVSNRMDLLKGTKIASCSFYDKLLTVWSLT